MIQIVEASGCTLELRRVEGPDAHELFFACKPAPELGGAREQADAIYRAIVEFLAAEGGDYRAVVAETVFFSDIRSDLAAVRAARAHVRAQVLDAGLGAEHHPALTEIEQSPQTPRGRVEVLVQAIIPAQARRLEAVATASTSGQDAAQGLRIQIGDEARFYAAGVYGGGSNAYEQTHAMFEAADALLKQAGFAFKDVMRTWIYFPEMERDYDGFNRARREFFQSRAVDPIPASTGIGAGLATETRDLCLGFYAVAGEPATRRMVMKTPTLNEAPDYGSDFSRGMRVEEANRTSLYISGTASLDETGATVHLDDFDKQVDRMLLNVDGLLKEQGASFKDIVYAITYLKNAEDAPRLTEKLAAAGYDGFPNVVVKGPVCRPELLCETEALAIIARDAD